MTDVDNASIGHASIGQVQTKIFVTFQQEGMHCWPTAPDEYGYLRAVHRHEFHVRVECLVDHNDRDIEMIDFKHLAIMKFMEANLEHHVEFGMPFFGSKSCEMMAFNLGMSLLARCSNIVSVEVSEDGENGAIVSFR
jgi:hypothetical protein